jgi:hypothetical protein
MDTAYVGAFLNLTRLLFVGPYELLGNDSFRGVIIAKLKLIQFCEAEAQRLGSLWCISTPMKE